MTFISLIPIYLGEKQGLLDPLTETLERTYHFPVRIRPPWFDPEVAFDSSRGQYRSTDFLKMLLEEPPERGQRVLAVTSVDIFVPVFTFVFGEAQLDGFSAVVSLHRLQNEVYGLPSNEILLAERLKKEVIHELGHTFGLIHCENSRCVMQSSAYVEDLELKSSDYCEDCNEILNLRLKRS